MNLIRTYSDAYKMSAPIAHFICADFKPRTTFYKYIDKLYDIKRKLKHHYIYYGDIYNFNKCKGDCIKLFRNNIKLYNLVVSEYKFEEATEASIYITLKKLRQKMYDDGIKKISICIDGIQMITSKEAFEDILINIFGDDEIDICLFEKG